MKDNWFENKMNERFDDFDSELDLNQAWEDLESIRQVKKKKDRAGIYWCIGLCLCIAMISLWSLVYFKGVSKNTITSLLTTKEQIGKQEKNEAQSLGIQEVKINENEKSKGENFIKSQNLNKKKILEKSNNKSLKLLLIDAFPNEYKNKFTALNNSKSLSSIPEKISQNLKAKEDKKRLHSPILSVSKLKQKLIIEELEESEMYHKLFCNFVNHTKYSQSFGLALNYGKSFRKTPTARADNNSYLQRRDMAETNLDAWSGELFYHVKNKKNWFTQINLGYLQATDLFEDSNSSNEIVFKEDQIVQLNMYPDGNIEEVRGSTLVNEEKISIAKFHQRYRQAFVGLEVGKEYEIGVKTNLRASIGGDYTIYQHKSGKVYLSEDSVELYQDLSAISNEKGGVFAGKFKLEIGREFHHNNELSLGLIAKSNFKILEGDIGLRQFLFSEMSFRKNF